MDRLRATPVLVALIAGSIAGCQRAAPEAPSALGPSAEVLAPATAMSLAGVEAPAATATQVAPQEVVVDTTQMQDQPCHAMGTTIMGACTQEDIDRLTAQVRARLATADAGGQGVQEVHVRLREFGFDGAPPTLVAGRRYRFVIENVGTVAHEFVLLGAGGSKAMIDAAATAGPATAGAGDDESGHAGHDHGQADVLLYVPSSDLPPGGVVVRDLAVLELGSFEYACHLVGHFEAGMIQPVTIVAQ